MWKSCDSGFKIILTVSQPIFKNDCFLWNFRLVNFHCLKPCTELCTCAFYAFALNAFGVDHRRISFHCIFVLDGIFLMDQIIILLLVEPTDVTNQCEKRVGF